MKKQIEDLKEIMECVHGFSGSTIISMIDEVRKELIVLDKASVHTKQYSGWTTTDIDTTLKNMGSAVESVTLTDAQKVEILEEVQNNSDAGIGTTWEDLENEVTKYLFKTSKQ